MQQLVIFNINQVETETIILTIITKWLYSPRLKEEKELLKIREENENE